jgi:hypothetical protein
VSSALQIGVTDRRNSQRFTRAFMQTSAMGSGPPAPTSLGPFARGTVTAVAPPPPPPPPRGAPPGGGVGALLLPTMVWADGDSTRVNVASLERQPGSLPLRER